MFGEMPRKRMATNGPSAWGASCLRPAAFGGATDQPWNGARELPVVRLFVRRESAMSFVRGKESGSELHHRSRPATDAIGQCHRTARGCSTIFGMVQQFDEAG